MTIKVNKPVLFHDVKNPQAIVAKLIIAIFAQIFLKIHIKLFT